MLKKMYGKLWLFKKIYKMTKNDKIERKKNGMVCETEKNVL